MDLGKCSKIDFPVFSGTGILDWLENYEDYSDINPSAKNLQDQVGYNEFCC